MTQISSFTPLPATSASSTPSRFSELRTEDFIRIIFTELSNQDPFQPNDSAALLNQLNSIRSIESDIELTRRLQSLVTENQLAAASNMLGSFVVGLTQDNDLVSGVAVGVLRQGDTILVQLDNGFQVPVRSIREIHALFPVSNAGTASSSVTSSGTP